MSDSFQPLLIGQQAWVWGSKTYVMGVINTTPDSFSDGGKFNSVTAACRQASEFVESGVDVIDIGGESTRPGAPEISTDEELERVIPVIRAIRDRGISTPISIDTTKADVANAAAAAGADLVNDVSGAVLDPAMLRVVAELGVPIVLMHMRGTPRTMQQLTDYSDVVDDVGRFLEEQTRAAVECGIERSKIIVDPGIGFAKTAAQSVELLRNVAVLRERLRLPLLVGLSRKSFLGHILQQPDSLQRGWGTASACAIAIANGADIVRVHDVAEMRDVCLVADALSR